MIADWIASYLNEPGENAGPVYNERSLQLEMGFALRRDGFQVEFERPFRVPRLEGSTLKPKLNLDLLVRQGADVAAVELKVPLSGRHPETMYDFCADIEFVESLKRAQVANHGFCLLLTRDQAFWTDSGRGSEIHDAFRRAESIVSGTVYKPTGARDTNVVLGGSYNLPGMWSSRASSRLMANVKYLLVEV